MDTRTAFDRIAGSWYTLHHRTRFRKELDELAGRWNSGRLLNIGCGHGPDFEPFGSRFELHGVDLSAGMLAMARRFAAKNGLLLNLVQADAAYLPYADGFFDCAIAVATYHHIRGVEARQRAFEELRRVLKPGGEAFLTVWNRNQPRFESCGADTMVPFRIRSEVVLRYYHLYTFEEFGSALEVAGLTVLRIGPEASFHGTSGQFSRNICALVRAGC